jgi:DNA modification methylase
VRWDERQAEKANIVANKAGGGWDFDTLANEFDTTDLLEWGFEPFELGIDDKAGTDNDAEPQIDRAEELREKWGVESGQLWRLPSRTPGQEHRLICGDCTDAAVVERVMGGELASLGVNDPPYNVAQDTQLYAQNRSKALSKLANSQWDKGFDPVPALSAMLTTLDSDAWCYVFTAHNLFGGIFDWMNQAYAKTSFCVWCKPNPMPSLAKNTWTFGVELCLYGKNGSPIFNYPDGEHCLNWWPFAKYSDGTHPTQKTLQVIEHIIKHCSAEGDRLSDLFLGSGTTLIAAENLSRQCRAVEISPGYVAVALERYATAFGIEPELVV